jgi:Domain of unknown function (DUF4281)
LGASLLAGSGCCAGAEQDFIVAIHSWHRSARPDLYYVDHPVNDGMIDAGALPGAAGGTPDFTTLAGVMALFESKGGTTIGWIHYLAFDLFVGIWVARNADRRGIHRLLQIPILFLVLMFGPIGLMLYLIVRQFVGQKPENAFVPH